MYRTSIAALCAAAAAIAAATSAQAAACRVTPISIIYGLDVESHMDVTSGASCSIRFGGSARGRTYSAGGGTDFTVSAQAQHGRATLVGSTEIAYRSAPGYVGPDRFTFETTGESLPFRGPPRRGTSHIVVDVAVVR